MYVLLLGIVHPPVGLSQFAVSAVSALTGLKIGDMMLASLKFCPALMTSLLLLMFVPWLTTWLPSAFCTKAGG
jgi:TRAP-type C4-dicarboxylate transport system permease large subunit